MTTSIVDLFKNTKARSKLFIQLIPPGYTEDEFNELIRKYLDEIDYFVFRPGKIIRDPYGHLIGLDCPNYGFATINFKNPRICPQFFREFHQFQLSDCYNFKSKLFIEFALMQSVPEIKTKMPVESESSFRELAIFKEFLKTFPFAAKAEEDRLSASNGPVSIDLEDENLTDVQEVPNNLKNNELDAKLSIPNTSTLQLPKVSFASLLPAEAKKSTEAVTPLTEYIKSLSLNEELPPKAAEKEVIKKHKTQAKKENKEKEKTRKETKKQSNKSKPEKAKSESKKSDSKTVSKPEKKPEVVNDNSKQKTTNSNVVKQPSVKGVPKILARKSEPAKSNSTVDVPVVQSPVVSASARQPYVPPPQPPVLTNLRPSVDAEPFIPPAVPVKITEQPKQAEKAKEKPKKQPKPKGKTLAERSELCEVSSSDKSKVPPKSPDTTAAPKKVAIKGKTPQKQSQPTSPKDDAAPVKKKIFTTSAKMSEYQKQDQ